MPSGSRSPGSPLKRGRGPASGSEATVAAHAQETRNAGCAGAKRARWFSKASVAGRGGWTQRGGQGRCGGTCGKRLLVERVLGEGDTEGVLSIKNQRDGGRVGPSGAGSGSPHWRVRRLRWPASRAGAEVSRDRAAAVRDGAGLAAGAGTRSGKMAAAQEADGAGSAVVAAGGGGSGQVRRPRGA